MLHNYQKLALHRLPAVHLISLEIGFGKAKPVEVINDDFSQCDCCGESVSNHNIKEAMFEFWLCGQCFSKWEAEDGK